MNPNDFASYGEDLLEQVQHAVDAPGGLRRIHGRQSRQRTVRLAAAAAAVLLIALVGAVVWQSTATIEPAGRPTTTTLLGLPVEASIVLIGEFSIDARQCFGTGRFEGITAGAPVDLVDESTTETVGTSTLRAGVVIDGTEGRSLGGPFSADQLCRFILDDSFRDDVFDDVAIDIGIESANSAMSVSGQRISFFFGGDE